MRRRALLLATTALPLRAAAQPRPARLGLLAPGPVAIENFRALSLPELAREGFLEGRNLEVIARISDGLGEPLRAMAAELLAQRPDVIYAASLSSVEALRALNQDIPIVMFGSAQLVGSGHARAFARPGRNVTGVVLLPEELDLKRLELAREAFPDRGRIGFLAGSGYAPAQLDGFRRSVAGFGASLATATLASSREEAAALAALHGEGAGVIVVGASPVLASRAREIAAGATSLGLPTLCEWRYMALAGCTLSYGPLLEPLRRRNAHQIARILRGEAPATIPIEIADRFEMVVNLAAARRLGIEFPTLLLARADEVLE